MHCCQWSAQLRVYINTSALFAQDLPESNEDSSEEANTGASSRKQKKAKEAIDGSCLGLFFVFGETWKDSDDDSQDRERENAQKKPQKKKEKVLLACAHVPLASF